MDNKITINLLIGRTQHPITISRDQEEIYRNAAKLINNKLSRYEQRYGGMGPEKCAALVMLDLAFNVLQIKDKQNIEPVLNLLEELGSEIDETIK